jgi:acetylglutamate kinase
MDKSFRERAHTLIEALPYIQRFSGKTVVIKYGGSAMTNADLRSRIIQDIALLKYVGIRPLLVHGGGPAINDLLQQVGVESRFENGLRVTDASTMEITEMVLAGKVNKELVRLLQLHGVGAVGLTGKDGGLLSAVKLESAHTDLGFVGRIESVHPRILEVLFNTDFVPVVAPVSADEHGTTLNINADDAAVAIAVALKAEKLLFLTDVPGILRSKDDPDSRISSLTSAAAYELIRNKTVAGGMVPKVRCAAEAADNGVSSTHIIDGNMPHALLLEILTSEGVGTLIQPSGGADKSTKENMQ